MATLYKIFHILFAATANKIFDSKNLTTYAIQFNLIRTMLQFDSIAYDMIKCVKTIKLLVYDRYSKAVNGKITKESNVVW